METCVFCGIIEGVVPASMVYSDEKVSAFLDVHPINPGHALVIPRKHAAQLADLDEETAAQMFIAAMRISQGLRKSGLKCEGINLWLADGQAAFQDIFHVHLHVIPRFKGDGFGLRVGSNYGLRPDRKELDKIALSIRQAMR
jgi:histidine triad (HIT) family protein